MRYHQNCITLLQSKRKMESKHFNLLKIEHKKIFSLGSRQYS